MSDMPKPQKKPNKPETLTRNFSKGEMKASDNGAKVIKSSFDTNPAKKKKWLISTSIN